MHALNLTGNISNSIKPDEIIRSLCIREGDVAGVKFMKYKGVLPDVFQDLNLSVIRYTKRILIDVDKATNSVLMPEEFMHMSSVSRIDDCNNIIPLMYNNQLHDDIADISLAKNCGCDCNCSSDLCAHINNYEAIETVTTELMPDDSSKEFTSITRKRIDKNGKVWIEKTYPVRKYDENNEFVDVVLQTETEYLCDLEVKSCGCVVQSQKNVDCMNACCNAETYPIDCGSTCIPQTPGTYGFSEQGNRIIFDKNFGYDKALVRFYADVAPKDLLIPKIAKEVVIAGIKDFTVQHEDGTPEYVIKRWEKKYREKKDWLRTVMNRCSLKEYYSVLNPPIKMF